MISKDHIYHEIESSGNLPTLPEILIKLLSACDDQETPISEIADIISTDPALSFRVLQLVNSAYYGFRHTFHSIDQAVVYLGADTIKNLALTTSIHHVFEPRKVHGIHPFDTGAFWFHSLMSATICKRIARKIGYGNGEEAYLSGLLHDIGKLLLLSSFPQVYKVDPLPRPGFSDPLVVEAEQVGINHCEAGSWLVRKWNLNSLLADAILYHHEPIEQIKEAFPLIRIVYAANILARGGFDSDEVLNAGRVLLRVEDFDFEEIVETATEEVNKIADSMNIRITSPPSPAPTLSHHTKSTALETTQTSITCRVKNVSLLSSFQENLMKAEEPEDIFNAFEKSMHIIFDIENVLFFLPDGENLLLRGHASRANKFHHTSLCLTLPMQNSESMIVKTFAGNASTDCITANQSGKSIADQQILAIFKCAAAYLIPLAVSGKNIGVVVLGLPKTIQTLSESSVQVLRIFVRQVSLCLHIRQEKMRKAETIQKERMAAISMTAKKFAHEINNPLGIISNYLFTLQMKLPKEQGLLDDLGIINEEIQRISSMVSQMDMFSQAPFNRFSRIDLNNNIREIVNLAKSSYFSSPGSTISFIPGTDVPLVNTSADAIKQIMINLLKNAAEAMEEEGGRVIVRTKRSGPEKERGIEIIVSDTGPGLPESVMASLYKPFVTTKQKGHSGLGLSITQKAVNDIGGKIFCKSGKEGTSFTINLPFDENQ